MSCLKLVYCRPDECQLADCESGQSCVCVCGGGGGGGGGGGASLDQHDVRRGGGASIRSTSNFLTSFVVCNQS